MNGIQILGLTAGFCTTIAFLPQVIKTWKEKSAKGLSINMFSIFCIGLVLWIAYGFAVMDIPVIVANLITLLLAATLLYFKFRFKD